MITITEELYAAALDALRFRAQYSRIEGYMGLSEACEKHIKQMKVCMMQSIERQITDKLPSLLQHQAG